MSHTWFQEIIRVMKLNNTEAWYTRRSPDKSQPIRKLLEMWNDTHLDAFVPGPNLTVDEQLLAFCVQCSFCQYISSKPSKYGIKIWTVYNNATSYVLKMEFYKGKEP